MSNKTKFIEELRARLGRASAEKERLLVLVRDLEQRELAYANLLKLELETVSTELGDEPSGETGGAPETHRQQELETWRFVVQNAAKHSASGDVRQFVLDALADGNAWSLGALKARAQDRGIDFGGDAPLGRKLHGALMGLKQNDLAEVVARGVWRKTDPAKLATAQ